MPDAQSDNASTAETGAYAYLDPLPDPAIIVGPRLGVRFANQAAKRAFPTLDQLNRGDPLSRFVRQPVALHAAEAALQNPGAGATQPFTLSLPGQVERRLQVRAVPITNTPESDDSELSVLLLFHDITAAWRTEQMRADFIANASHELRTPIASLLGYIETLQGHAKDDPAARDQFLDIMNAQASRMSRLISDLMSLSRIELDEHMMPLGRAGVASVLNKAMDVIAPLVEDTGIMLDLEVDPKLTGCNITGDEDELVQVFVNLIDNALKYGGDGGRIEITAAPSGRAGFASLAVRDFGQGIASEHLPRLTERFYRVDVRTSRQRGGTGLGLAIVKHIINRHKGELRIQSKPGEGSRFEVLLPCSGCGEQPAPRAQEEAENLDIDVYTVDLSTGDDAA